MKTLLSLVSLLGLFSACHRMVEANSVSRADTLPVPSPVPAYVEPAQEDPAPAPKPILFRRARCGQDVIL